MWWTKLGWIGVIAALGGCGESRDEAAGGGAPELKRAAVETAPAGIREVEDWYPATGTVRGRTTAVVASRVSGYVRELPVTAGDRVKAGQVLAVLEATDTAAAVRAARAGLDEALQARAEADEGRIAAQAGFEIAATTGDRLRQLLAAKAIPQQEVDDADARRRTAAAQRQMAEARRRAAAARVEQARAELAQARTALGYARVLAPFDGRVSERRVDPGALAAPGMPLLVLDQEGPARVEAAVEESLAGRIRVGAPARVAIASLGREVTGTVAEVVPAVDTASRAFLVKVDLPAGAGATLQPGMYARARFLVGTRRRLVMPAAALAPFGQLDRVFIVDGDRARLRLITVGAREGDLVEVLSGLDDGELTVLHPEHLTDGQPVTVSR